MMIQLFRHNNRQALNACQVSQCAALFALSHSPTLPDKSANVLIRKPQFVMVF